MDPSEVKKAEGEAKADAKTDAKTEQIKSALLKLHGDELLDLAKKREQVVREDDDYWKMVGKTILSYLRYLRTTWSRALWGTIFLPTNIFDRLSIYAFAFFSSVILGILLVPCLVLNHPSLKRRYETWSKKNARGLSMTNASYPYIFHELLDKDIESAKAALAADVKPHPTTIRIFNLDVAKLLLQCSAIMYERSTQPLQNALDATTKAQEAKAQANASHRPPHPQNSLPELIRAGHLLSLAIGQQAAQAVRDKLNEEEDHMANFAKSIGFEYSTISELNSQSSAFCGIFYDPASNYMIVAFRGTSPVEWNEWAADFTYEPRHAGHTIRGFGKVHGGFFDRIFPRKITRGARMPYDTIKEGIKKTATILSKGSNQQINVWFTGHSLGTALATLVYATAISEPNAFGENVILRDAYLFATPIVSDVQSVHSFHNRMGRDKVRTMWRITNGKDIVATGLPHSGDHQSWSMSPYNLFSFAHLGMEIKLKPYPKRCEVTGNQFPHGSHVRIHSWRASERAAALKARSANGSPTPEMLALNGSGSSTPLMGGNEVMTPLPIDGAGTPNAFDSSLGPFSPISPNFNGLTNGLKLNGTGAGSSPALSLHLNTDFGANLDHITNEDECASPTFEEPDLPLLPLLPPFIAEHHHMPSAEERQILREQLRRWQKIPIIGRFLAHSTAAYWDQLQNVRIAGCDWIDE